MVSISSVYATWQFRSALCNHIPQGELPMLVLVENEQQSGDQKAHGHSVTRDKLAAEITIHEH